ncbi:hypothetical protein [Litoreibacter roseus]|uniref:Uncharacterized protein n=1 Tax=Litoreibacter roseus TaxID=2601869 RepID=A0A6N6JJM0_9RHOB|nr:hypothetical protein [Litoreibacter roseus]GFE66040.1 hypothetical protein KIN_31140 [Litoreibacter roseus]
MDLLITIGALVTLAGLGGLIWCIIKVTRAKKSGLDDAALRDVMQSTVALNLAALFMSAIGLAMVVTGIVLS